MIQGFRVPVEESPQSARGFVTYIYMLPVASFNATYVEAMHHGLQLMENFLCHPPLFIKKPVDGHKQNALQQER